MNDFLQPMPSEMAQFWSGVRSYKRNGDLMFTELAEYALSCLSIPISTAVVERVFSQVTFIKNKQRNRLKVPMLDALLTIKSHLQVRDMCCKHFQVKEDMIRSMNFTMYLPVVRLEDGVDEEGDENIFRNGILSLCWILFKCF